MLNIIRASFYKLIKDWTFRITMIIGVGLAVLLILINYGVGSLTGEAMLVTSVSPTQNFGLTVPINLIVFTVGEFTFGTIRNKIIAGHSKFKLYVGLFLTGLIFTFSLMFVYLAFIVGISSIAGGFDLSKFGGGEFVGYFILYFVCTYVFVTSLSIFFGSLFRNIGGSISLVVVSIVIIGMLPLIITLASNKSFQLENAQMWINPLYFLGFYGNSSTLLSILSELGISVTSFYKQTPQMIAAGVLTPLIWAAIFFTLGAIIFKNRDVK